MLGSQEMAEIGASELDRSDFASDVNGKVFLALKGLVDEGLTVNPISVLERSGVQQADLDEIIKAGERVTASQLKTLLSEVKRIAGLRTVFYACGDASKKISNTAKLEEILEGLEKNLYRLDREGGQEASDGSEVMTSVAEDVIRRSSGGGGPELSTGLAELDRAIIGLRPGKMMVVAGRPGMGKSALSTSIRRAVIAQGYGAIEFSLEMPREEILERELAFESQINLRRILAAKDLTPDECERIRAAAERGRAVQGRWFIDDRTSSIAGIRRRSRLLAGRMARNGVKLGLVILDYIQLAGENGEGREQSVAAISRGCKLLAKDLGCTVMALSQLNRMCEHRDDKRPMMSDVRESGSIEQDADIIAFVYRDHVYDQSVPEDEAEVIIRKHRSGPTGTVRLRFNPKLVVFEDRCKSTASTLSGPKTSEKAPTRSDVGLPTLSFQQATSGQSSSHSLSMSLPSKISE
jgi:replicative DNA helicase